MNEFQYPYLISPELGIKLIGIHGKAGSGKSTFAEILNQHLSGHIFAFADPLKFVCAKAFGISIQEFYEPGRKEIVNEFWNISPRKLAQFIGTEVFRDMMIDLLPGDIGSDFWVKRLHGILSGELEDVSGMADEYHNKHIIVEDVRFQNEVDFIQMNGGKMIHIIKQNGGDHVVGIPNHASETQALVFNKATCEIINNDGTLDDLENKVIEFVNSYSV
jgi:dephospho-CoA kinase